MPDPCPHAAELERLVRALAIATGRKEAEIRWAYGIEQERRQTLGNPGHDAHDDSLHGNGFEATR